MITLKKFNKYGIKPDTKETTIIGSVYKEWYKESGYYFVVSIKKNDLENDDIYKYIDDNYLEDELNSLLNLDSKLEGYIVKSSPIILNDNNRIIMKKIVHVCGMEQRDPYYDAANENVLTYGYIYDELEEYLNQEENKNTTKIYHPFNEIYNNEKENIFNNHKDMHFCLVAYDKKNKTLLAGVTTPIDDWTHLYYGNIPNNNEIMYSNNYEILEHLGCTNILEIPSNSYLLNNNLYGIDTNNKKKTLKNKKDKTNE